MIIENTIKQASELLKNKNICTYQLDAELLLSEIMNVKREFLSGDAFDELTQNLMIQDQEIKLANLKQ